MTTEFSFLGELYS